MPATTTPRPVGQRDEIYYWDNICFSVEGVLFKVPRLPFIVGSDYFAEKYGLRNISGDGTVASVTQLDGVAAAQFRLFLKLLLPLLPHLITPQFTKDEWLSILNLSTFWRFHDVRNLAIQRLDSQLTDLGLIRIGRTIFHTRWVLEGYKWLILRPKLDVISEEEAHPIGHEAASKLWIIRYQCNVSGDSPSADFIEHEVRSRFAQELADLERREEEHYSKTEVDDAVAGVGEEERREGGEECSDLRISATDREALKLEMKGSDPTDKVTEPEEVDWYGEEEAPNEQATPLLSESGHGRQNRLDEEQERLDRKRQALIQQEETLREKERNCTTNVTKWKVFVDNPGKTKRRVIEKWEAKYQRWNGQLLATQREIRSVRDQLRQLAEEQDRPEEEEEVIQQEVLGPRAWGAVFVGRGSAGLGYHR